MDEAVQADCGVTGLRSLVLGPGGGGRLPASLCRWPAAVSPDPRARFCRAKHQPPPSRRGEHPRARSSARRWSVRLTRRRRHHAKRENRLQVARRFRGNASIPEWGTRHPSATPFAQSETQRAVRLRRRRRTTPVLTGCVRFSRWIRASRCMPARSGCTLGRKCGSARGARRGARTLCDRRCMSRRTPQPLREQRRRQMRSGGSRCGRWTRTGRRSRDKGECSAPTPAGRSRRGRHRRNSYTWRRSRCRPQYSAPPHRDRGWLTADASRASLESSLSLLQTLRGRDGG